MRSSLKNHRANRRAISEVIATITLIAVTVLIGAAAWIWASSQSISSQNSLGQQAQTDIQAVSERFQIIATNFTGSAASVWIYNSGIYNTSITTLLINTTSFSNGVAGWSLPKGQLTKITVTVTTRTGDLQTIKAVGKYGSYATYQVNS